MNAITYPAYHLTGAGFLRVTGEDRLDFIQRQSTNDLSKLAKGRHLGTVLTNPAARVIDVLQIFPEGDETLAAVTLPGRGPATALFLKKRIFFNDKVAVEDASDSVRVLDLLGPVGGGDLLDALAAVAPGEMQSAEFEGEQIRALGFDGSLGPVRRLVVPAGTFDALTGLLEEAGFIELTPESYNVLRVEAGLPGPAGELTEDHTPLETGLAELVSDTKGCYTGQEVIARQITYDKVTKGLAGIRLEGPVRTGARVRAGEANAGVVTSYANSPRAGHLALAVLKRPHTDPGTKVAVETENGEVEGEVLGLPFA